MKFQPGIVPVARKLMKYLVFVGLVAGSTMLLRNQLIAIATLADEND